MQICSRVPCSIQSRLRKPNAAQPKFQRVAVKARCQGSLKADGVKAAHDQAVSLPALLAAPLLMAFPAFAEEATETAAAVAKAAPADFSLGPAEIFVLLSPIIIYGGFNVYRSKYNPRATFIDFMLIFGAFAVFGNIISITAFHQRIF